MLECKAMATCNIPIDILLYFGNMFVVQMLKLCTDNNADILSIDEMHASCARKIRK